MKSKLKIDNFQQKVNLPEKEHEVLKFWDETRAFEKSVEMRSPKKRYVFYDGPPFATGLPHYGHILVSTIKDAIPRYWTMKGYRVERVWGWDCHGIPIENIIEQELHLKGGKKGIEEFGIDKFNTACRAAIFRFDKEWEKVIKRIGRWVDFKNSYKTMDITYMESVWWAFKTLYEKGLVYEGRKVILYCPRCATPLSNFEIAMDNSYKDMLGPSTVYKFRVKNEKNTYLLAWSTTPWNKLATPALAVNPDLDYVNVKQGDEYYILAKSTLKMLNKVPYSIIEYFKGKDLEKIEFELLYDFYPERHGKRAGVVIADDYVTAEDGTGIVTLAIYGEDDYRVMTKHNIQLVEHVDMEGRFKPEVTPWVGMYIIDANPLINADLAKRGLIYWDEPRMHSVPVCYRCETRLYHAPVPAWFINIRKMKSDLLAQNENINWYPDHLKYGRFGKGLETAPDWNISRSRYWGTPMPIWRSSQKMRIIGSLEELKKWAVDSDQVKELTDIHREYLDDIEVWVDDEKTIKGKRIPEVFDCWVESGSMPYASLHYPFKDKQKFEEVYPAQFITEYIAQTRAWFYTLHVMSVGIFKKNTFENALTTGTILAEDGAKMSKSKKNFPDPTLLFEKYGVDALRLYLMGSVVMKAENLNFSEKGVKEIYQKVMSILWNVTSFYKMYTKSNHIPETVSPIHILDNWIVSRTNSLIKDVTDSFNNYDTVSACRKLTLYIDELSTWYLRRSRERIKNDPETGQILGWVLLQVVKVLSPLAPFITEIIYQNLVSTGESIHWQLWPEYDQTWIQKDLETDMKRIREIVEKILAQRKEFDIPVRQPLACVVVKTQHKPALPELIQIILDEVNIKKIEFKQNGVEVEVNLDTKLTPELKMEGKMRELMRKIQILRKEKRCKINEHVSVQLTTDYKELPERFLEEVKRRTLVNEFKWGNTLSLSTGRLQPEL